MNLLTRTRLWGLAAVVTVASAASALAGDPNMSPDQTTLWNKLFGPKPAKATGPSAQPPRTITAPLSPEVIAKAGQAEQDAYLRRLNVCTELRCVADERGDAVLSRQVDELERQAATVYNTRVTALGVPKLRIPLPEPATAMRVDEPVSPRAAATRLTAPSPTVPTESTAEIHEVKP